MKLDNFAMNWLCAVLVFGLSSVMQGQCPARTQEVADDSMQVAIDRKAGAVQDMKSIADVADGIARAYYQFTDGVPISQIGQRLLTQQLQRLFELDSEPCPGLYAMFDADSILKGAGATFMVQPASNLTTKTWFRPAAAAFLAARVCGDQGRTHVRAFYRELVNALRPRSIYVWTEFDRTRAVNLLSEPKLVEHYRITANLRLLLTYLFTFRDPAVLADAEASFDCQLVKDLGSATVVRYLWMAGSEKRARRALVRLRKEAKSSDNATCLRAANAVWSAKSWIGSTIPKTTNTRLLRKAPGTSSKPGAK